MNFEQARFNMVEQQIRPWDVLDPDVLDTLMAVHREAFVPEAYRELALAETQIPLGHGQHMLTPVIEGKVLQAVRVQAGERVLEIGTGSGFMAACLAHRAASVVTVERVPALAATASASLSAAGFGNVVVECGDGAGGWPVAAPFDLIVYSAGVTAVPDAVLAQLAVGGRLFAFVGEAPLMHARRIDCVAEGVFRREDLFESVVPMLVMPSTPRFDF